MDSFFRNQCQPIQTDLQSNQKTHNSLKSLLKHPNSFTPDHISAQTAECCSTCSQTLALRSCRGLLALSRGLRGLGRSSWKKGLRERPTEPPATTDTTEVSAYMSMKSNWAPCWKDWSLYKQTQTQNKPLFWLRMRSRRDASRRRM
jgi:hypothetical protein